jgi:hypothetical protein
MQLLDFGLHPDRRVFTEEKEKLTSCVTCGIDLVVLPNDRRSGHCFDCLRLTDNQ